MLSSEPDVYQSAPSKPPPSQQRKLSVPLFRKIEVDFDTKEREKLLLERKEALQKVRDLKRPIERSEILSH